MMTDSNSCRVCYDTACSAPARRRLSSRVISAILQGIFYKHRLAATDMSGLLEMNSNETGLEFENRARNVARAIHDPMGLQGAVMFQGQEYDAVFQSEDAIHAYEFTTDRKKEKAVKDSKKLNDLLIYLHRQPENKYLSCTGWVVTKDDPTAEQRAAVDHESRRTGMPIYAISIVSLQRRLCDAEGYLRCRDHAPFGSTAYSTSVDFPSVRVDPEFSWSLTSLSVKDVSQRLINGERAILVGEFGVGKSYAMRELYRELRKEYLKSSGAIPFPLHINLRDCAGLRSPAEVLRRHAEEIGFPGERSLISAWRAGSCILLLDGFDEIVPTRWLGSASDLRQVRWQSLTPIRRIVEEAPGTSGIAVCGRPHFFSSSSEMHDALGFLSTVPAFNIEDFSEKQLKQFLVNSGVSSQLPEWLPARPLLIGYLIAIKSLGDISSANQIDQADAWRELFNLICRREAEILTAVRPETIKNIISRVATLARSRGDELGPIGMGQMERAFVEVNGVQPDEEGIQLLLRLPGLATMDSSESRVFIDRNLADTAYGEDLSSYVASPYDSHPLAQSASWVTAATQLGIDVAARALADMKMTSGVALAAAKKRQAESRFDAVLADTIRIADALHSTVARDSYLLEGVIFEYLAPDEGHRTLARATLQDCVIDILDIGNLENADDCPQFHSCLIGYLDGATAIPQWLTGKFTDCEIDRYADHLSTAAGIMQLKLPNEKRVALTVLKKIYSQRGSGRKESALSRGLDQQSRLLVPSVVAALVSDGWIWRSTGRSEPIYLPAKGRRSEALQALDKPGDFRLKS
jgi:hypothetical protein